MNWHADAMTPKEIEEYAAKLAKLPVSLFRIGCPFIYWSLKRHPETANAPGMGRS